MDHYETLEVSRNASPAVIRAAYKSLMQRLHPDKHPSDQAADERAALVARAYEVLSDADRRAAYDRELRSSVEADRTGPLQGDPVARGGDASEKRTSTGATLTSRRTPRPAPPSIAVGIWALSLVVALGLVSAWIYQGASQANPQAELETIRQAFDSGDITEADRQRLFERKRTILSTHPELLAVENVRKADDMAGRTFALLEAPVSVQIAAAPTVGRGPVYELSIAQISLLVGTFDSGKHLAHLANHRERLVAVVSERLAQLDPGRLTGPRSAAYLNEAILGAIVGALGTEPTQTYPSTFFESPGRYGVISLVLPESFKLVQIAPWQE